MNYVDFQCIYDPRHFQMCSAQLTHSFGEILVGKRIATRQCKMTRKSLLQR